MQLSKSAKKRFSALSKLSQSYKLHHTNRQNKSLKNLYKTITILLDVVLF